MRLSAKKVGCADVLVQEWQDDNWYNVRGVAEVDTDEGWADIHVRIDGEMHTRRVEGKYRVLIPDHLVHAIAKPGRGEQLWMDVAEFHDRFDHPVATESPSEDYMNFRLALLHEEVVELAEAVKEGALDEVAREVVDVIYVAVGMLVVYGIPLDRVWDEVHRANMDKVKTRVDGEYRPVKPRGWKPPQLTDIVIEAMEKLR